MILHKDKGQYNSIEDLIQKAGTYIKEKENLEKIKATFEYADSKHEGQYRKSGDKYIVHPLNVAIILTTIYADTPTIQAGLLHDVLEDCDVTYEELEKDFGSEVAKLVYGVTKLSKINFSTENDYLIEYYKKIIVGMSEDVRAIIVKLADRLHNMRTLFALPLEKQKSIAKETIEILAPIAHHLGIHKIKSELEDLSLRYLKPDVFYDIAEKLNKTKLERENTVIKMQKEVANLLTEHNIAFEIKGRAKSIYSIYNKLDKGKKFSDIYDLSALRILVNTTQECYLALGIIHSKFRPLPKRFKDYIAMPKANMYQSLHTTVFGIDGYLFEIQIRTYQMDEVAENGIASHWAYKEHKDASQLLQNTTEQKLQFFKAIMELQEDKMSSEEFVNSVKDEVLNNNIYVFTPMGDIIELPIGATPIDFAYRVHSKVGDTMVGAMVNNSIVPLNYELQNNDIVKINTSKSSVGPSKEWLNIVKTTQARNKIKSFFAKSERSSYIERGKETIEKELRKQKISFQDFNKEENINLLLKLLKIDNLLELYFQIGVGKISTKAVVRTLVKPKEEVDVTPKVKVVAKVQENDVIVDGIDKVKVSLASCCKPIPDDEIIGYITKGNGITVHRSICHNLTYVEDRTIKVEWNEKVNHRFNTDINIYMKNAENHLVDIIQKANSCDILVNKINTTLASNKVMYEIEIALYHQKDLEKLFKELRKLSFVEEIERVIK